MLRLSYELTYLAMVLKGITKCTFGELLHKYDWWFKLNDIHVCGTKQWDHLKSKFTRILWIKAYLYENACEEMVLKGINFGLLSGTAARWQMSCARWSSKVPCIDLTPSWDGGLVSAWAGFPVQRRNAWLSTDEARWEIDRTCLACGLGATVAYSTGICAWSPTSSVRLGWSLVVSAAPAVYHCNENWYWHL